MKGILSNLLVFTAGAAVGAVVTWKLTKDKYARIAQKEIDSMREYFNNRMNKLAPETTEDEKKEDYTYGHLVSDLGYSGESDKDAEPMTKPCVISPEELGDREDYEIVNLTYYADDVLADDIGEPVEDIDFAVGADFADHFGEYEPDSVHVRNDERKLYYEILRDSRTYASVVNFNPFSTEDE